MDTLDFTAWLYGAAAVGATIGYVTAALMRSARDY